MPGIRLKYGRQQQRRQQQQQQEEQEEQQDTQAHMNQNESTSLEMNMVYIICWLHQLFSRSKAKICKKKSWKNGAQKFPAQQLAQNG